MEMDWYKKWFSFYQDDEDEWLGPNNDAVQSKELKTKVTYQYPKSSTNRPLIEKGEGKHIIHHRANMKEGMSDIRDLLQRRHEADIRRYEKKKEKTSSAPQLGPTSKQNNRASEAISNDVHEVRQEKIHKKRPFHPTEIPSPIYGFQRRKKQDDIIEFELTTFERNAENKKLSGHEFHDDQDEIRETVQSRDHSNLYEDGQEKEQITINQLPNRKEKPDQPEYSQQWDATNSQITDKENSLSMKIEVQTENNGDKSTSFPDMIQSKQSDFDTETQDLSSLSQEAIGKMEETTPEQEKNQEINDDFMKAERTEAPLLTSSETAESGEDIQLTEWSIETDKPEKHYLQDDPTVNQDSKQQEALEFEKNTQEPVIREDEFAKEPDDDLNKETVTVEELTESVEVHPTNNNMEKVEAKEIQKAKSMNEHKENVAKEKQSGKRNDQEQATKPTTKKHLPFNVLMLKKDREFLKKKAQQQAFQQMAAAATETNTVEEQDYQFPSRNLLNKFTFQQSNDEWIEDQKAILNNTLRSFHVGAKVVDVSVGPTVTRFELSPDMGVKVSKITNLTDDLKLSLAAKEIRIEAPIPGKHTIGIEVPNKISRPVYLRDIIDQPSFIVANSPLTAALGLDITGKPIMTDIKKMPHGLIAGATGSGKSVCINTFIISLLYKARPEEVKLLLIDPKMVELSPYNGIPHLISPVITDVKAATQALKWAVDEMERRYELFAHSGVRDISKFNEKCEMQEQKLPYIVIIIDELADLMMMAPADVEEAIARIAQKARACGIHLLIATQRPSVDVITGLIKANVPTRIAFSVSSQIDSRTIIDISGAERLLGKGDMLFVANGTAKPVRIQGAFITDEEIEKVVDHVRTQGEPNYLFEQEELIKKSDLAENDELLYEACEYALEQGNISTSSLQRHFRIGYNRAARIIELMEEKGMISEAKGSKPRDVLMTNNDLDQLKELL